MEQEIKKEIIDFESMSGSDLIEFISWKDEYPREAEQAFVTFCDRYEKDLIQKAEIYCSMDFLLNCVELSIYSSARDLFSAFAVG